MITGSFLVTTDADSGPGSLRQAILDSNTTSGGTGTIEFAISGAGLHTIALLSPLPAATTSVLIDGTTQPGYAGTPLIAIDDSASGSADGLTISGSGVTLSGVAIGGFGLGQGNQLSTLVVRSGPLEPPPGGQVVTYRIDTTTQGRLTVLLHTQGLAARLSLVDSQGKLLVRSDGLSPRNRDSVIDENLASGTYTLIAALPAGADAFTLTTTLAPSTGPFQPVPVWSTPNTGSQEGMVAGDFNGDGRTDLAIAGLLRPATRQCPSCWATAMVPTSPRSPTRWVYGRSTGRRSMPTRSSRATSTATATTTWQSLERT